MATPNITPRADSEGGIGTASKYWASAYIDAIYLGAGFIGRDLHNLIDFSVDNRIAFKVNNSTEINLEANVLKPATNDGIGLGEGTKGWSDLHLASGAVINFANSDLTLTHSTNALTLADGDKMQFGTGADIQIHHTSNESFITNTAGHLYIQQTGDDNDIVLQSDNGSGGVAAYLTLDGTNVRTKFHKDVNLEDGVQLQIGNSQDLKLYHSGSHSFIDHIGTGNLHITQSVDDADLIFQCDDGSGGLATYFFLDGDNVMTQVHKNFRIMDSVQLQLGTSGDLSLRHDTTNSEMVNLTGNLTIQNKKQDKDIIFQSDDGQASDSTTATYFYLDGSSAAHDGSATTALYTNWPDKSRISLGTSHDATIQHDGTDSLVDNNTGNLYIRQQADDKDIIFQADDGSGGVATYLTLDGSAGRVLVAKTTIFTAGITADTVGANSGFTGNTINLGTGAGISVLNKSQTAYIALAARDISGSEAVYNLTNVGTISAAGGINFAGGTCTSNLTFNDGNELRLGTDSDMGLFSSSGVSHIRVNEGVFALRANDLRLTNQANDETYITAVDDGAVTIYHNNVAKLATTASGVTITGGWVTDAVSVAQANVEHTDNTKSLFGNGNDLQIYHNATDSFIVNETGNLKIVQGADDKDIIFESDNGSGGTTAYLTLDGSAGYTTVQKKMRFEDNVPLELGTDRELTISSDGSNGIIANQIGSLVLTNAQDDGDIILNCDNGSGGTTAYLTLDGGIGETIFSRNTRHSDSVYAQFGNSNDLQIYHDGTDSHIRNTQSSGDLVIRNSVDDKDIIFQCDNGSGGDTTYFFLDGSQANTSFQKDVIFADGKKALFGGSGDLQMYHDGNHSYIQDVGTGSLYLRTNGAAIYLQDTDGNAMAQFSDGGGSFLMYNGSLRLHTTTTGISVTGTAAAAVGAGFDGAETVTVSIAEINQETITTIQIDLGTGGSADILSSTTAGDVIGEDGVAAAFITKYDSTKSGVLYKAELICLETPVGGVTDINLTLNAASLAEDAAGEVEGHVIIDGAAQAIGKRTESTASVIQAAAGGHNDYVYLTVGTAGTAGTYSAGKFLIRLYGALAAL